MSTPRLVANIGWGVVTCSVLLWVSDGVWTLYSWTGFAQWLTLLVWSAIEDILKGRS